MNLEIVRLQREKVKEGSRSLTVIARCLYMFTNGVTLFDMWGKLKKNSFQARKTKKSHFQMCFG